MKNNVKIIIIITLLLIVIILVNILFPSKNKGTNFQKEQKENATEKQEQVPELESLDGSATGYTAKAKVVSLGDIYGFHTFLFHPDLTCDIETYKQNTNNQKSSWPPSEPDTEWSYFDELNDLTFDRCNYQIIKSKSSYQIEVIAYRPGKTEEQEKATFTFKVELDDSNMVYKLKRINFDIDVDFNTVWPSVYYFDYNE